jgi:hypothetical protein
LELMKTRPTLSLGFLALCVGASVACSDGSSSGGGTVGSVFLAADSGPGRGPSGGLDGGAADAIVLEVVGCDAGATGTGCGYLNVTLSGGFSASDCCYACGSTTDGFSWMIDQDRVSFQIQFPQGEIPLEQAGTFPLDSVLLDEGYADGGIVGWQTPPGSCTVAITRSVCVLARTGAQNWLTGSGHCSQPAEPTPAKGPAAPVTIGDFTFRGYILFP